MSNKTASANSSESPATDIPNSQETQYSMDRIRLESIERRRQECTNIIKERKRKLSELYCVSRLPFMPISNDQILQIEDKLMAFLEKNDLENGHEFNIAALSKEKQYRKSHSPQPQQQQLNKNISSSPSPSFPYSPSPINQDKASDSLSDNNNTIEEPPRKLQKLPFQKAAPTTTAISEDINREQTVAQFSQSDDIAHEKERQKELYFSKTQPHPTKPLLQTKSESVIITRRHLESSPDELPTLSSLIYSYSNDRLPKRSDECSSRDIDIDNIDIKKLMVTLMPESKPHKVAEARSLTELYYHQQTLQLPKLLLRAHKTLTTDAFETSLVEGKVSVLHSRIEELKRKNSWSLRQPKKFIDPFLKISSKRVHWDYLLSESKWISIDMKEERRYKLTQCVFLAQAIQDYWTYGNICCINRAKIIFLDQNKVDEPVVEIPEQQYGKSDKAELEKEENEVKNIVKNEIMEERQRNDEDAAKKVHSKKFKDELEKMDVDNTESSTKKVFTNLFDPSEIPTKKLPQFSYDNFVDATKDRIIPFKVYANMEIFTATEKAIVSHLHEYLPFNDKEIDHIIDKETYGHISAMIPPLDEEPEYEKLIFRKFDDSEKHPSSHQSGLFGPFRRINILKPPRPPSIKNLELRIPTIWLPQDDKYLIKYVTEFSFNWDIIAAHLSAKPTRSYTSNIERRTPWQCFERYIQLNDKFQFTDMRGTFAINAKEWLEAAHQAQATTKRRISPLGVGTESIQRGNRRLRWGSMFEAMRKLMKKRENAQKTPTQHRKTNHEATRADTPTPEQLSKLKFDRDRALQEAYAQQNPSAGYQRMRVPVSTRQMAVTVATGGRLADSTRVAFQGSPQATMTQTAQQAALQQRSQSQRMQSPQPQGTSGSTSASQVVSPVSNGPAGINMPSAKISRPTTPNGTQLTPEQIQRLLNLQRQKQLAQQQSHRQAMMLQQQHLQQQLKDDNMSRQQPTSSAPVSASGTPQLQSAQLLAQAKMLAQSRSPSTPPKQAINASTGPIISHPLSSATSTPNVSRPPSRTINRSQNGGIVPTPEQVLQNAIKSSNSPSANSSTQMSPTPPPAKIQRNQSHPVGKQPRPAAKFTFTHAQISAIVNQIQAQNPTLPKEQVTKLATSYLAKLQQKSVQMQKQQTTPSSSQIQQQGSSTKFAPSPKIPTAQIGLNSNQSTTAVKQSNKQPQQLTLQQLTTLINNPKLNPQQKKHLQVIRQRQLDQQHRILEQQKQNNAQQSQQPHAQLQPHVQLQPHQLRQQPQLPQQPQTQQQQQQQQQQRQQQSQPQLQQPQQRQSAVHNQAMTNASPQRKDVTGKTNSPSITTRFSPQPGSSVNMNYYRKAHSPSDSPIPSRATTPSLAVDMNQGKVHAPSSSDGSTVTAPATGYDNSTCDDLNDLNKLDALFGLNPDTNGDKN